MSFTEHTSHMETFCNELEKLSSKNVIEDHLYQILSHLCDKHSTLDACISNSPFYEEFFLTVRTEKPNDMNCFALLECLIIFCRERQLQNAENFSETESNLLQFYQNSAHWDMEQNTHIHQWYWHVLPNKYKNAS